MNITTTKKDGLTYYELTNQLGSTLRLCNLGARLIGFETPVNQVPRQMIVSGQTKEDFLGTSDYFGATIGRFAGRIAKGLITLDEKEYDLSINEHDNTLHGGIKSFESKLFTADVDEKNGQVAFSYRSPHLENGFPGDLDVTVVFTLFENEATYSIEYFAKTDATTIFNPTNHGYYNLLGNATKEISDHKLCVNSDAYLELGPDLIPTGKKLATKGSGMDFTTPTPLSQAFQSQDAQNQLVNGIDHPFILNPEKRELTLTSPNQDVTLTVTTDRDAVVLFTSNFEETVEFSNRLLVPHGAVAIETQNLPDAMHHPDFGNVILKPNEDFYSKTTYHFETK